MNRQTLDLARYLQAFCTVLSAPNFGRYAADFIWATFAKEIEEGPGYLGIGLLYIWMIFVLIWFWFLDPIFMLGGYQNLAVILLSFVVLAIIGAAIGWRRSGLNAFDFTD